MPLLEYRLLNSILIIACLSVILSYNSSDNNQQIMSKTENISDKQSLNDKDWELVWSDEFEGESLNEKNWNRQLVEAGRFNEEWQRYTNSQNNAYVEDGILVLKADFEGGKHGLNKYTSARLNTAGKQSWTYGKIQARIKLPFGKGIWPAFWMLGSNINENGGDTPWPFCGEIDILELYGSKNDGAVEANIHYSDEFGKHRMMGAVTYELDKGRFADGFHLFEFEWNENELIWSVDGESYARVNISSERYAAFHKDFFLLLNIAVGGTYAGRPDSTTSFPQFMYVDWIRVYQQTNS